MEIKKIDYEEYNKPPFLPGFLTKEQTLELAKTPDKQLDEIEVSLHELLEQYSKEKLLSNTVLLDRRGKLLGLERNGLTNEQYYYLQELRILLDTNRSTVPDIVKILKQVYPNSEVLVQPDYPAKIKIIKDGVVPSFLNYYTILKETVGAGIEFSETVNIPKIEDTVDNFGDVASLVITFENRLFYDGKYKFNGLHTYNGWVTND